MMRSILGLMIIILVQATYLCLVTSQPTKELIEITPSPDDVVVDELVDEVTHLVKIKVKITVKLAKGEKSIVNWTEVERRENEFYVGVEMYKLKGVRNTSTEICVNEGEFELGKLEGGTYKVHVVVNGKLVKTEMLVVPRESGESRTFSPKPEYATILLALIALVIVSITIKYFTTR